MFKDYDVPPEVETMTNNGHSVTFTIEPAEHMDYPKVFSIKKLNQTTVNLGCNELHGTTIICSL